MFRQCTVPNLYMIGEDVPVHLKSSIIESANYWNETLETKVFVYGGQFKSDGINNLSYLIAFDIGNFSGPWGKHYCQFNNFKFLQSGCLMGSKAIIQQSCTDKPNIFKTYVRKSFGLVLGLNQTMTLGNLMYRSSQPHAQHPIDASNAEIRAAQYILNNKILKVKAP